MPGVRSAGQIMIGCWCDEVLVEKIDRARRSRSRSEFCREAVAEKLRTMGVSVAEHETASPDRTGKGGPKRLVYPIQRHAAQLNERSPAPESGARKRSPGKTSFPGAKPKSK